MIHRIFSERLASNYYVRGAVNQFNEEFNKHPEVNIMNIKSITTLGLVAVALGAISIAPAEASNNNAYLNQLAMQMYMQNQATAATNASLYNPALNAAYSYPVYGAATNPWGAYALPAATVVNPYVSYGNVVVPHYIRHDGFRDRFHR
jgi:hypothetical protein